MRLQASPTPAPVTVPHRVGKPISPTQRRQLARAVADLRRTIFSIDADNHHAGVISAGELDDRLDAGVCVVVRVRAGLLAVDFDHTPVEAVDGFVVELEAAGLEPVVIASGGEGRRHVWVRTNDPAWAARARQLGGDVRRSIRPPGVPHRCGVPARLLNVSATEALRRLRRPRGHTTPASEPVARLAVSLGWAGVRLPLPDGSQFVSASEAVRAAACRFHGRGGLPGDLVRAMDDATWGPWMSRLAKHGRERSISWLVHYVWPTDPAPTVDWCDEPAIEAAVAAAYARAASQATVTWATLRVLDELIARARHHSTLTVGLSVRQAAEQAGVAKQTAQDALRRLVDAGVIVRVMLGRGGRGGTLTASEWRILGDDTTGSRTLRTPPGRAHGFPPAPAPLPTHDVISGAGLGHSTLQIYSRVLNSGGQSIIADLLATHRHPSSQASFVSRRRRNLMRHLRRLARCGLVRIDGDQITAVADPDLDTAARCRDPHSAWQVVGRIERHLARHQRERDAYLDHRHATAHREWTKPVPTNPQPAVRSQTIPGQSLRSPRPVTGTRTPQAPYPSERTTHVPRRRHTLRHQRAGRAAAHDRHPLHPTPTTHRHRSHSGPDPPRPQRRRTPAPTRPAHPTRARRRRRRMDPHRTSTPRPRHRHPWQGLQLSQPAVTSRHRAVTTRQRPDSAEFRYGLANSREVTASAPAKRTDLERCACGQLLDPAVWHDEDRLGQPLCESCCATCGRGQTKQFCILPFRLGARAGDPVAGALPGHRPESGV